MPAVSALESGNPDSEDESRKAELLAKRAARFTSKLPGNRYKELEELRAKERKVFENQGLIKVGKTELGDAVDMRGTCERMCSEYEREFREYTREIHPFEAAPNKRMDPEKAVAAYSRSDAGAGHGDSAILPSDLRTPATLVKTLDYLFSDILSTPPPTLPSTTSPTSIQRKALGYSAGFIRDRSRAIRKEFAMQSSWGHDEAIASFERIARWHILCLRELQEESGTNTDMHIDSAELGRCFTSLRQHYNDRREETGVETPCPNEPEFRAYMLIFDLTSKSISIPFSELPSVILDHPLVKLAWSLRAAAQRNFDTQKEGSKLNAELGANLITRFVRLLQGADVPFLMGCLVEIRLREMRRSALRSMMRTYPRLRSDAIRTNERGEVVERRMVLLQTLEKVLGCEEQEDEEPAWDDLDERGKGGIEEAERIVRRFEIPVYEDQQGRAVGALINLGSSFNDNKDAPYTRRWKSISAKRGGVSYTDVINGKAGVTIGGAQTTIAARPAASSLLSRLSPSTPTSSSFGQPKPPADKPVPTFSFAPPTPAALPPAPATIQSSKNPVPSFFPSLSQPASAPAPPTPAPPKQPTFSFSPPTPVATPPIPTTSSAPLPDKPAPAPLFSRPSFFSTPAEAGPSSAAQPLKLPSPPRSLSPPRLGSLPSTTTLPSLAPQQASLSTSLSRSVSRRPLAAIEAERQRNKLALPLLCDELIAHVVSQALDELAPDLLKLIRQEEAGRAYNRARAKRKEVIDEWSGHILRAMVDDEAQRSVRKEVLKEIRRRWRARKAGRWWRQWAQRERLGREEAARDRDEMILRLKGMGLAGGGVALDGDVGMLDGSAGAEEQRERVDEFEVDISLQQSNLAKDNFYAKGTLFTALARDLAPAIPSSPKSAASFRTPTDRTFNQLPRNLTIILSTSSDPSTSSQASEWLASKFAYEEVGDEDDGTGGFGYRCGQVAFHGRVLGRYDEVPRKLMDLGMVVFEAPPRTYDSAKKARHAADAQDRLAALAKVAYSQNNMYTPGLIILTWEDEDLDEVVERLSIAEDVACFGGVEVFSLESSHDLDNRWEVTVERLAQDVRMKEQVVLHMEGVVDGVLSSWERLLDVAALALDQRPTDPALATDSFRCGVELLASVPHLALSSRGHATIAKNSLFNPVSLPAFSAQSVKDMQAVAFEVEKYLQEEALQGLDDVGLMIAPMHRAAFRKAALPIPDILRLLGMLVFGELRRQSLPLNVWTTAESRQDTLARYNLAVATSFEAAVEDRIHQITRPRTPKKTDSNKVVDGENGTAGKKRSRADENTPPGPGEGGGRRIRDGESKSSKSARLKRALEEVERTLQGIEGVVA